MKLGLNLTLVLISLVFAVDCDDFSVVDQFQVSGSPSPSPPAVLAITSQIPAIQQNSSTELFPTGGTTPYSFMVLADSLAYTGTMGTVTSSPYQYNSGTSIGSVKVRVQDAAGVSADCLVTVLPPPPTAFSVVFTTSPTRGNLSWSYPIRLILPAAHYGSAQTPTPATPS